MTTQTTTTATTGQKYPVSDFVFDVVTLIHERCKGMEALRQYQRDAQQGGHNAFVDLSKKMLQQDEECVRELTQILARNLEGQ